MSHCRIIQGLEWARMMDKRPSCIPVGRPRGVKALGIRYEKTVGKLVQKLYPSVLLGKWFEFEDKNGFGYCQPDIIIPLDKFIIVGECKLSETDRGRVQIDKLYRPILENVFKKEVRGVVISKFLTKETNRDRVFDSLSESVSLPSPVIPTFHFLGRL